MRRIIGALAFSGAAIIGTAGCEPPAPTDVACMAFAPHSSDSYHSGSWDGSVYRCTIAHSGGGYHKYCVFPPGSPPDDSWASGGC